MDSRLKLLLEILKVNDQLFQNCLAAVDDATAWRRPNDKTNNLVFLGLHLVDARFFLAGKLGSAAENPLRRFCEGVRGIDDFSEFPSVAELLDGWSAAAAALKDALDAVPIETLDAEASFKFPVGDRSWLGGVAFLMQHESYHIGQMALLRKYFGLEAMTYEGLGSGGAGS